MLKKTVVFGLLVIFSCQISAKGFFSSWFSSWWNTTTYNGSRILRNGTYTNLTINGAAKLRNIKISGDLEINGASIIKYTDVGGSVTLKGSTKMYHSIFNDIILKGNKNSSKIRLYKSEARNITVEGLGECVVSLIGGTTVDTISFGDEGGIVLLYGRQTSVKNGVVNGVIIRRSRK